MDKPECFNNANDSGITIISIIGRSRLVDAIVMEQVRKDLLEVLDDAYRVDIAFIDEIDALETDLAMVTVLSILAEVVQKVRVKYAPIIMASRTFFQDALDEVYTLPPETKVLVVNRTLETTIDIVRLLYEQRIHHIHLIPYDPIRVDASHFEVAITPGEKELVPNNIHRIIDIGYRRLDTQTFLSLFSLLHVSSPSLLARLVKYMEKLISRCVDTDERFLQSLLLNQAMKELVEYSDDGIIVLNDTLRIAYINQRALLILNASAQSGTFFNQVVDKAIFETLNNEMHSTGIIKINDTEILYTKRNLIEYENFGGSYIRLRTAQSIQDDNVKLHEERKNQGLLARYSFEDISYQSQSMARCIELAKCVSRTDYTVLLEGETGTGKELVAQSIHNYSPRSQYPFVTINCTALPESLFESELFGYESGAFTGSKKEGKVGLFEQAQGGTVFLDEVGDISLSMQLTLLRVLQERQITRIGGNHPIDIDVRIIAATNKHLADGIAKGTFRDDLYYRLNTFPIQLPPLRQRIEDILLLFEQWGGKAAFLLTPYEKDALAKYHWLGNVRELHNVASYYRLMQSLPPQITEALKNTINDDATLCIHLLFSIQSEGNAGIGREKLAAILEKKGIHIGKGKLELLLQKIHQQGLIHRRVGRGGSILTQKGEQLLVSNQLK